MKRSENGKGMVKKWKSLRDTILNAAAMNIP